MGQIDPYFQTILPLLVNGLNKTFFSISVLLRNARVTVFSPIKPTRLTIFIDVLKYVFDISLQTGIFADSKDCKGDLYIENW